MNGRKAKRGGRLFDIVELPTGKAPVKLAIAIPRPELTSLPGFPAASLPHFGRVASGRGLGRAECQKSALGEAAELVSCCAWGDEDLITAHEDELGLTVVSPDALNGFTSDQLRDRQAWNVRYADFDWRPKPYNKEIPIDWLRVENAYGGAHAYIPADFAFIGRKTAGDPDAIAIGDSNGCACGQSIDDAKLAALLELIERDATGRWWYGCRARPLLDPVSLEDNTDLVAWLAARSRQSWLLDLTTDLGIPVVAAVSAEPDGSDVALGFAARLDMRAAAVAALTEMVQMELPLMAARALGASMGQWGLWCDIVRMTTPPLNAASSQRRKKPISAWPAGCSTSSVLEACARSGITLWFADMTRVELGVPAFRAISSTLCYSKARFGRNRLLALDKLDDGCALGSLVAQVPLLV